MIDKIIQNTSYQEDVKTLEIFKIVEQEEGSLSRNTIIKILKWKSPRPLRFYNKNEEVYIKNITQLSFKEKNDKLKIHILTALKGVNYPSASSILMFKNPDFYPVLDIRVWKQLYKNNLVSVNPRGIGFTLDQWDSYVKIIRSLSRKYNTTAREIEKKLFDYDKLTQEGNLY